MKKWILSLLFFVAKSLHAEATPTIAKEEPWLTGSLIAPLGRVVPYGDFMVRSYLYAIAQVGRYNQNREPISQDRNFYTLNAQFPFFWGLTPWCDLNIIPQLVYQTTYSQHYFYTEDLTVGLDFQLLEPTHTPYFPGIKLALREIFPTGNFEYFHPRKLGTDQTGEGAFGTEFDLVLYQVFHLGALHWLSLTWSGQCTIYTPVNVHGFNSYGGGFGASGKVCPGNQFKTVGSFELTLNQNWAVALDAVYIYREESEFFGRAGITFEQVYAPKGVPSSDQFSLAPAIEYNFNDHLGWIAGCWFSVFGRNSVEFRSGVMNIQYTY